MKPDFEYRTFIYNEVFLHSIIATFFLSKESELWCTDAAICLKPFVLRKTWLSPTTKVRHIHTCTPTTVPKHTQYNYLKCGLSVETCGTCGTICTAWCHMLYRLCSPFRQICNLYYTVE